MSAIRRFSFVALFLILAICPPLSAEGEKFTVRVKLTITCRDCEGTVRSYLSRELRKLPDVIITDDKPDYDLRVIAFPTESQGGVHTGYAMAVLVLNHSFGRSTAEGIESLTWRCPKETQDLIKRRTHGTKDTGVASYVVVSNFGLRTFSPESLERECRDVIAAFDGDDLEEDRKNFRMVQEALSESHASGSESTSAEGSSPVTATPTKKAPDPCPALLRLGRATSDILSELKLAWDQRKADTKARDYFSGANFHDYQALAKLKALVYDDDAGIFRETPKEISGPILSASRDFYRDVATMVKAIENSKGDPGAAGDSTRGFSQSFTFFFETIQRSYIEGVRLCPGYAPLSSSKGGS